MLIKTKIIYLVIQIKIFYLLLNNLASNKMINITVILIMYYYSYNNLFGFKMSNKTWVFIYHKIKQINIKIISINMLMIYFKKYQKILMDKLTTKLMFFRINE